MSSCSHSELRHVLKLVCPCLKLVKLLCCCVTTCSIPCIMSLKSSRYHSMQKAHICPVVSLTDHWCRTSVPTPMQYDEDNQSALLKDRWTQEEDANYQVSDASEPESSQSDVSIPGREIVKDSAPVLSIQGGHPPPPPPPPAPQPVGAEQMGTDDQVWQSQSWSQKPRQAWKQGKQQGWTTWPNNIPTKPKEATSNQRNEPTQQKESYYGWKPSSSGNKGWQQPTTSWNESGQQSSAWDQPSSSWQQPDKNSTSTKEKEQEQEKKTAKTRKEPKKKQRDRSRDRRRRRTRSTSHRRRRYTSSSRSVDRRRRRRSNSHKRHKSRSPIRRTSERKPQSLSQIHVPQSVTKHIRECVPPDMPKHMAHRLGAVFKAAELTVQTVLEEITKLDAELPFFRVKVNEMRGPMFRAPGRDDSTVFIFHGTSLNGAIHILKDRQVKAIPEHENHHCYAIYGKGFVASGEKHQDKKEIIRILGQMAKFPKNQCGIVFQLRSSGKLHKVESGGTYAEEQHLEANPFHITHVRQGKVSRWACRPDNATITAVWIVEDIFDFQEYDPISKT